ncbi:MAG: M23 family metallopeptidase [Sandaracinaceae bacterium]|nr:M23 family metallopeptidase [Sandaracinaceae bacterium]
MRRSVGWWVLGVLAFAAPVAADPTDDAPIVDLATRVPERWLEDTTEDWPLTPERWRRRMPPECRTRGGYRDHCQGERLVPEPHGPAADLARRLGLGQRATALQLMHARPLPEWLAAVASADPDEHLTFPVANGHLGRGFGRTRTGSMANRRHWGVDIGAAEGSPILAARGGIVAYADNELTGFGNVVMLLHFEGYTTFYAHCRRLHVFAGQRVERGQRIAEVGQTGFAPAPHLHFEWRQRGWARDPVPLFLPRER